MNRRRISRLVAASGAAVLAVALGACSSSDNAAGSSSGSSPAAATSSSAAAASSAETSAAPDSSEPAAGSSSSQPTGEGSSSAPTSAASTEPVTLNWWHNGTGDPLKGFWQGVANDFHTAHPTVTIQVEAIETNQLQRTRIPAALQSGDPPDIFQAWGGGEIVEQVAAGYLKDITDHVQRGRPHRRRPPVGRSTASTTGCRSAWASRASGTTRSCSRRRASPPRRPRWTS